MSMNNHRLTQKVTPNAERLDASGIIDIQAHLIKREHERKRELNKRRHEWRMMWIENVLWIALAAGVVIAVALV